MSAEERNQIFRDRLIALNEELNAGANNDQAIKRIVGLYAINLPRDAGTRDWTDLKARADGPTYDSLLRMFQKHSEEAAAKNDTSTIKAIEVMAISLIARRQYQADLMPGVTFIDKFIANCAIRAKRANARFIPSKRR